MPIDPVSLWRQIDLGEDSDLELKEARFRSHAVSTPPEDDLAAFAIDEGKQQPVHFRLHEPLHLTDSLGANATLWFREMVSASCVFDYRRGDG